MSVSPGTRLGSYEIVAAIGAGGMGQVYRARDVNLDRDVAIKLLPHEVTSNLDWRRRFEREARLLASITHPNVATVHGFETIGDVPFLVMELVPGETLAVRLDAGRLPLDDALNILRQIAAALEVAHDGGIVHRDLKPANIKITPDGTVKVLDFGIAKVVGGTQGGAGSPPGTGPAKAGPSETATMMSPDTQRGLVVGTAPYMSPEQARGKPVDRRSDIWSFGCIAYEILSWQPAFRGETATDTIAVILRGEPDWSALPADLPIKLHDLVRRCLQKDPARRLRDARDIRLAIEELQADPGAAVARPAVPAAIRSRRWLMWAAAGLAVGVAATLLVLRFAFPTASVARQVIRFPVDVGTGTLYFGQGPAVAISPDGTSIVYVAMDQGVNQLYLRRLHDWQGALLPGTSGGSTPFFSPDGRWVAFTSQGKLKKVPTGGGEAVTLADAPLGRGGAWMSDDSLIFAASSSLWRVSASGGAPQTLIDPGGEKPKEFVSWPSALPGRNAVLYTGWTNRVDNAVMVRSLDTGVSRALLKNGMFPRYAPSGHVVFARFSGATSQAGASGQLWAAPFDLDRLELTGDAVLLLDNLRVNSEGGAHFGLSDDGTLIYVPTALRTDRRLVWVDRNGMAQPLTDVRRAYQMPRLSPEGRRIAVGVVEPDNTDIWVLDLDRSTSLRLTFDRSIDEAPVWSPDGQWIVFSSSQENTSTLVRRRADGSGSEERLTTTPALQQTPQSWSPDGRWIVYSERNLAASIDLWFLPLEGTRQPKPFLARPFQDRGGVFSPDGRFIAHLSNESGRNQVYVRQFPDTSKMWLISNALGTEPVWSRDGKQLFYRNDSRIMAVTISTTPTFKAGPPLPLFDARFNTESTLSPGHATYDVAADGRFVFVEGDDQSQLRHPMYVVVNWFDELKRRVPSPHARD